LGFGVGFVEDKRGGSLTSYLVFNGLDSQLPGRKFLWVHSGSGLIDAQTSSNIDRLVRLDKLSTSPFLYFRNDSVVSSFTKYKKAKSDFLICSSQMDDDTYSGRIWAFEFWGGMNVCRVIQMSTFHMFNYYPSKLEARWRTNW